MRAVGVAMAAAAISGSGFPGSAAGPAPAADRPTGRPRVLVAFQAEAPASRLEAAHAAAGGRRRHLVHPALRLEAVEVADVGRALVAYRSRPEVAYAEPDGVLRTHRVPADGSYPAQWNLHPSSAANPGGANWEPVHPRLQGQGVTVAVLDTGFRPGGPDQPVNVLAGLGYDFVNNDPDPTDDNGHGTHVAGTIAQRTGDSPAAGSGGSVAGVAPQAAILPVKVLDARGEGTVSAAVAGIGHAVTLGAKVINLSLGGEHSRALCEAVREAARHAVVVAASGNEAAGGLMPVAYPAACPGAVAVGALRHDASRSPYSNGGCETALTAPGGDQSPRTRLFGAGDPRNAILQERFIAEAGSFALAFDHGTSMAAAHVAGAAALLLGLTPDVGAVTRALRATARDLGPRGPDDAHGHGALDIAAAVHAIETRAVPAPAEALGYWMVAADGGLFAFGDAPFHGSTGNLRLNSPIVAMARSATGGGYWLAAADGGVFAFGDARFLGSTGNLRLNRPIVGMVPSGTGNGYWLVASDGGIFSFGDAEFFGSPGGTALNLPVVAMVATRFGKGYWLVASDGGIFAFGDAPFLGSTGGIRLNQPIVDMARSASGGGYWLVASDGGIFSFGDAPFRGSTAGTPLNRPIVGMAGTCRSGGYWLVASDGGVFGFGDGRFLGSTGDLLLNRPVVGMAVAVDHRGRL